MTKVPKEKSVQISGENPETIDTKVRMKKRKKRKDLEQIRRNVLDARQDLRRERRVAGAKKYKGPINGFDRTLRSFADIREENENKTQGISSLGEKKSERILCAKLLPEPAIGLFKNGVKGHEIKRVNVILSEATEARRRSDVLQLLHGDGTPPRKLVNNGKKIIAEEKKIPKEGKSVCTTTEECSCCNEPHRSRWRSKEQNPMQHEQAEDNYKKRLFDYDDDEELDQRQELLRMEPLHFSPPRVSRVDDSDTIEVSREVVDEKKLTKNHPQSVLSLNRWRWSPATCFEEFCSIVCVKGFSEFVANCGAEDPETRIRNSLGALYKQSRSSQNTENRNNIDTVSEVRKSCTTTDTEIITPDAIQDRCLYDTVSSKCLSASSLTPFSIVENKIDKNASFAKQYFKNLDTNVQRQNDVVEQTAARRVPLEQSLRMLENSREVLTSFRNRDDKCKSNERSKQEQLINREGKRKKFHQVYLSNSPPSSEIQKNRSRNHVKVEHSHDDEYKMEEHLQGEVPSPPLYWSASHQHEIIQLPRKSTKHIPSILRHSIKNKKVHFNPDLSYHQPDIYLINKETSRNYPPQITDDEFLQATKHQDIDLPKLHFLKTKYKKKISPVLQTELYSQSNCREYKNQGNFPYQSDNYDNYYCKKMMEDQRRKKNDNNLLIETGNYVSKKLISDNKNYPHELLPETMRRVTSHENKKYQGKKMIKTASFESDITINDSILRGFKVLSFTEEQRSRAKYGDRGKLSGHFLSSQPTKYLAVNEENNNKSMPRRIPIYRNVEKAESIKQNVNDTMYYYKSNNQGLPTPPPLSSSSLIKIYPQSHEFNHTITSDNNSYANNNEQIHFEFLNENHQLQVPDNSRKIHQQSVSFELYKGQPVDQTVRYFLPENSYEENSPNCSEYERCYSDNCRNCYYYKLHKNHRYF